MSEAPVSSFAQGEEARAVLADRAGRMERQNKPRYLLVAAGGLVAIAMVWLGTAWWRSMSASDALLRERSLSFQIQDRIDEYLSEQQAQTDALGRQVTQRDPNLQFEIERLGKGCGLATMVIQVGDDLGQTKNFRRKRYSYNNFAPQETEQLLCWINKVKQEVAGVELASVDIEPGIATVDGKARWKGTIAFSRWELKN
jgi:hypothetical protein